MIENKGVDSKLDQISVLIEDTNPSSVYFNITNLPEVLPVGKTAFSIDPPEALLKKSSNVKIQLKDVNGNPVYIEIPNDPFTPQFAEGYSDPGSTSRLISITIYSDTPVGFGELIIVGEAAKVVSPTDSTVQTGTIPPDWQGVYNVRWSKKIMLDKNQPNSSRTIFYETPQVAVTEIQQTYLSQVYAASKVVTLSGSMHYQAGGQYANIFADGGFQFTRDMVGGVITFPSPNVPDTSYFLSYGGKLGPFTTYISSVVNSTQATVMDIYTASFSQFSSMDTDAQKKRGIVTSFVSSPFTMSYNSAPSYTTSPNFKSFAKFDITNLDTFSGYVYRVKVFKKSDGSVGDWKLVTEKNMDVTELLYDPYTTPDAQYYGVFAGLQTFTNYWTTSSFDFKGDVVSSYAPTMSFNSDMLLDGIELLSNADTVGGYVVNFFAPLSSSIMQAGEQLTLNFKLASRTNHGALDVYASGSAFKPSPAAAFQAQEGSLQWQTIFSGQTSGLPPYKSQFGKLLATFNDLKTNITNGVYGQISVPFTVDNDGTGSIQFAIRGGDWVISEVSLQYPHEDGFNPNRFTFVIPIETEQEGDSLNFLTKYYNKLGQEVIIPQGVSPNGPPLFRDTILGVLVKDTNPIGGLLGNGLPGFNLFNIGNGVGVSQAFQGQSTYMNGTRNVLSGSLWIASHVGKYAGQVIASGGIEISADSAQGPSGLVGIGSLMRSVGYEGWISASLNAPNYRPGFMIWSGSVLPGSGDNYSGVGIELWGPSGSLHFDTVTGILSITGSINAESGTIGGWKILPYELVSFPGANLSLSGSGQGYIIARDKSLTDRVFFGLTPDSVTGSDGWRDYTKYLGNEEIYNQWFQSGSGFIDSWSLEGGGSGSYVFVTAGAQPPGAPPGYPGGLEFGGYQIGPHSASQATTWITSVIANQFTLGFWTENIGGSGYFPYWSMNVNWYQSSNDPSGYTLYQTDTVSTHQGWEYQQLKYTATTTGSLKVEFSVQGFPNTISYIRIDGASLKRFENFTDVSQKGLYVFNGPTSFLKLGAGSGMISIGAITASLLNIQTSASLPSSVIGSIQMGGSVVGNIAGGIYAISALSASVPFSTDYYMVHYWDASSNTSTRGGEVATPFGDSGSTDFNYYSRIGGGGSVGKNRGWVFADSSVGGHSPYVQIVVGGNGFLAGDGGAVIIQGPIYAYNPNSISKILKLQISGSGGNSPIFQFVDGNQGVGKVLTSDANGNAAWSSAGSGSGGGGTGITWVTVTGSVTMSANTGYIVSQSNVQFSIPSTCATGSLFEIAGQSGGWSIVPSGSQTVFFGNVTASSYVSNSLARDSLRMVCVIANTEFNIVSAVGNLTMV